VKGWGEIATHSASGPFAAFAMALGMAWLAMILYIDAVVSPFGTALLFTGGTARLSYAMSRNQNVPKSLGRVNRWGVPGWSLLFNFIVGVAMLLPVPGWAALVGILTSATILAAGFGVVAAAAARIQLPDLERKYRVPMLSVMAPVAFIFCSMIVYWSGFKSVSALSILVIIGLGLMPLGLKRAEAMGQKLHMANAVWVGPYFGGILCISWLGQFGGTKVLPSGIDHVILAIFSLTMFYWAKSAALSSKECLALVEMADDRHVDTT
jgi:amino acid transporter